MPWLNSTTHKPRKAMTYRVRIDPENAATETRAFWDCVSWSDLSSGKRCVYQFFWWRR